MPRERDRRTMTIKEIYQTGARRLREAGIDEADLDAWYLLEYVSGITRAMYYIRMDEALAQEKADAYLDCIRRRSERIPLQHITGEQEFMGLPFYVSPHVLIPRQDTEILVEEALRHLKGGERVLDLCTGSGCIALSLAAYRKTICAVGSDISPEALETAGRNAARAEFAGLAVSFTESDLFEKIEGEYDMIVSNPPYIPTAVIASLSEEVRLHDPMRALDGREDGLYFYRRICGESPAYLKDGGRLLFEIGHDQSEAVGRMMRDAGFAEVCVKKDLAGLDRVVSGRYNRREK